MPMVFCAVIAVMAVFKHAKSGEYPQIGLYPNTTPESEPAPWHDRNALSGSSAGPVGDRDARPRFDRSARCSQTVATPHQFSPTR
jgi:hypothetical protein